MNDLIPIMFSYDEEGGRKCWSIGFGDEWRVSINALRRMVASENVPVWVLTDELMIQAEQYLLEYDAKRPKIEDPFV